MKKTKADLEQEIVELKERLKHIEHKLLMRVMEVEKLKANNIKLIDNGESLVDKCHSLRGRAEGLQHALDAVLMSQHHQGRFGETQNDNT